MCRHLLFLNCTPFIDVQIQGSLVHQQVPAVRYCSPTPQASHFQLYPLTCTNFTFSPNCNYIACDSKSWECRFGKSGRFDFSGVFLDNTRSAQQRAVSTYRIRSRSEVSRLIRSKERMLLLEHFHWLWTGRRCR